MADYKELIPIIKKWEGGYVNDPDDSGGSTNKGVTLATFRTWFGANKTVNDLKALTDEQWIYIFLNGYWNQCKASEINNQSIANIIVDWAWASGPKTAIKKVQSILGTDSDGIVGPKTLAAINNAEPRQLFNKIKAARLQFVETLAEQRPKDKKWLQGWKNRINSFFFEGGSANMGMYGILAAGAFFVLLLIARKWK